MFLLLLIKLSFADTSNPCSGITSDISIEPNYIHRNNCSPKEFSCSQTTYNWERDHYKYKQRCRIIDISEYQSRLDHYKLISHNGAVIVGDHLDECVSGGINAIKKRYTRQKKLSSLFSIRKQEGESKERVQFIKYSDGAFHGDGRVYQGATLPLCTKIVMLSSRRGKRPDTQMIQLHCGTPTKLKNDCYVMPSSKTQRVQKIRMNGTRSSTLYRLLKELQTPEFAISDMEYKIANGCSNSGRVPQKSLAYQWDLSKEELSGVFSSCVGPSGFLFEASKSLTSFQNKNMMDFATFNDEDVLALKEKLIEKREKSFLKYNDVQNQISVSKIRHKEYTECIQNLDREQEERKAINVAATYQEQLVHLEQQRKKQEQVLSNWNSLVTEKANNLKQKKQNLEQVHNAYVFEHEVFRSLITSIQFKDEKIQSKILRTLNEAKLLEKLLTYQNQEELFHVSTLYKKIQTKYQMILKKVLRSHKEVSKPPLEVPKFVSIDTSTILYSTQGILQCRQARQKIHDWDSQKVIFDQKVQKFQRKIDQYDQNLRVFVQYISEASLQLQNKSLETQSFPPFDKEVFMKGLKIHTSIRLKIWWSYLWF